MRDKQRPGWQADETEQKGKIVARKFVQQNFDMRKGDWPALTEETPTLGPNRRWALSIGLR